MKSLLTKSVVVLLVALQVCALVVVDDHHLEDVIGLPNAQQKLITRDCGTKGSSKDIPHYCLACLRHANFSFVFAFPALLSVEQSLCSSKLYLPNPFRPADFYISASKRGPPLTIS